jgi:hypothetical protein
MEQMTIFFDITSMQLLVLLLAILPAFIAAAKDDPYLPFQDVTKFAVVPECKQIFEQNRFTCGDRCKGSANGTTLFAPIVGKEGFSSALVLVNHQLKTIFVSFRSSDGIDNWLVDAFVWFSKIDWEKTKGDLVPPFKFAPKSIPSSARIHAGLKRTYVLVRKEMIIETKKAAIAYPQYKIVFTGLSLGAAMAMAGAVDFYDQSGFGDRISVYTYGAARIGNQAWRDYVEKLPFAKRIYRINSYGDPVSYLPPKWFGYRHIGRQFNFKDFGPIAECSLDKIGESPDCYHPVWKSNTKRHFDYYSWAGSC